MKKISIHGESRKFDYEEIESEVVLIKNSKGETYYWKSSKYLTKVKGRYYRKNSPLVVKTKDGKYLLKTEAIRTEEGFWVNKEGNNTVTLKGKIYLKESVVTVGDEVYLKTDPKIAKVSVRDGNGGTTNTYALKIRTVLLDKNYYGSQEIRVMKEEVYEGNDYHSYKNSRVVKTTPFKGVFSKAVYMYKRDTVIFTDASEKTPKMYIAPRTDSIESKTGSNVFWCVNNRQVPYDLRNIIRVRTLAGQDDNKYMFVHEESGELVLNSMKKKYLDLWAKYYKAYIKGDTDAMRKLFNDSFSDRDENENTAEVVKKNAKKYPGGRIVEGMDFRSINQAPFTSDLSATGGLAYTFGIELEYSAGEITSTRIGDRNVALAGDGSVGMNELVSGLLHGSVGMKEAEDICRVLSKNCFVDDRCGVHVHVGGHKSKYVSTPKFGKDFNINAIKLGSILEEELFMIMPKSRNPRLKYCAGIKKFSTITREKWRKHMGEFVFGAGRTWEDGDEKQELGRWPAGRYKWLNIVNCATRGRFTTIEFRIWSGTTDWKKLRAFILLSLAFVNFLDKHSERIWSKEGSNLRLIDVVEAAYGKNKDIVSYLENFIEKRKISFGRNTKEIYGK